MAQKLEPIAHEDVLAELWFNLLRAPRRALCELAYLDPSLSDRRDWVDLPIDSRVRLVRAMRVMSQLSIDCAIALERARASLSRARA